MEPLDAVEELRSPSYSHAPENVSSAELV